MPTIIRLPEVIRLTGKSSSSIYSDIEMGRFSRSVSLGTRSKGWIKNEVTLWILKKMRERDRLFGRQFSLLPMRPDQADSLSIIRLPKVILRTGKSRSTIYSDIQKGRFPRPVRLGARSAGWIENEVALWILGRIRERERSPIGRIHSLPIGSDQRDPTIHVSRDAHPRK